VVRPLRSTELERYRELAGAISSCVSAPGVRGALDKVLDELPAGQSGLIRVTQPEHALGQIGKPTSENASN